MKNPLVAAVLALLASSAASAAIGRVAVPIAPATAASSLRIAPAAAASSFAIAPSGAAAVKAVEAAGYQPGEPIDGINAANAKIGYAAPAARAAEPELDQAEVIEVYERLRAEMIANEGPDDLSEPAVQSGLWNQAYALVRQARQQKALAGKK